MLGRLVWWRERIFTFCLPVFAAGPAVGLVSVPAHASSSIFLSIDGHIDPTCGFTSQPAPATISGLGNAATVELGVLAFSCNLAGGPAVNVSVSSANGGLRRDGGAEVLPYGVNWQVPGWATPISAQALLHPYTVQIGAGPAQSMQGGAVQISLPAAVSVTAGTYRDTLTYTISP
jgi:hypothetical protein